MPVHWTVSHPKRLVVAMTKGTVDVDDIEQYFTGVTNEGGMGYRKIFEVTHTPEALTDENLKALGSRMALYAANGQVGPVAIVASNRESYAKASVFAAAAKARRPIEIFHDVHSARHWLDAQPEIAPAPDRQAAD